MTEQHARMLAEQDGHGARSVEIRKQHTKYQCRDCMRTECMKQRKAATQACKTSARAPPPRRRAFKEGESPLASNVSLSPAENNHVWLRPITGVVAWLTQVWGAIIGRPAPPNTAAVLLAGDHRAWPVAPELQPLWTRLRLTFLWHLWRARR